MFNANTKTQVYGVCRSYLDDAYAAQLRHVARLALRGAVAVPQRAARIPAPRKQLHSHIHSAVRLQAILIVACVCDTVPQAPICRPGKMLWCR